MIPAFIDENGNFKINRYKTNSESDKANAIAHSVPINDSSKFVALVPDQLGYKAEEKFIRDLTDKYAKDSFYFKSTHQKKVYLPDETRNKNKTR